MDDADADAEPMQIDILEDILLADDDEDEEFNDNEANQNNVGINIPPPGLNLGGAIGNGNDGEIPGVVVAMIGAAGAVGVGGTGGQNQGQGLAQDADFQVENPTLDLDTYAASYKGMAKLLRLVHIADHCPSLKSDAIKMALNYIAANTSNVELYQSLHKKIRGGNTSLYQADLASSTTNTNNVPANSGGGESSGTGSGSSSNVRSQNSNYPPIDNNWIESTSKRCGLQLEKLDADLKNYKANSIKESIRRGLDDMGEFYLECGDLMNALKSFTRSRDYCTSAKHLVQMCLNIIKVSIYLQNWGHVSNYVLKAENTPDLSDEKKANAKEVAATNSKLKCAAGLAELAGKKYKAAAHYFLGINFDSFDCPEIISQGNVAVYAGLCALASFDRVELQESVIGSSSFKQFLELEPPVRDVIHSFHESKYGKCLQLMDEMRDNLLLDIYLAPHVLALYSQIRSRGLIQYFVPYAAADMVRMAAAFNTSVPLLENELMALILSGDIEGRIDSQNKVLVVRTKDERAAIFEKTLKLGAEYERKCKLMVLRTLMMKYQICVKNPAREDGQGGHGHGRVGGGHFNNHL